MKHIFKTTPQGKLDITIRLLDKDKNEIFYNSSTYDIKPTIRAVINYSLEQSKFLDAVYAEILSTPSCLIKTYPIKLYTKN